MTIILKDFGALKITETRTDEYGDVEIVDNNALTKIAHMTLMDVSRAFLYEDEYRWLVVYRNVPEELSGLIEDVFFYEYS